MNSGFANNKSDNVPAASATNSYDGDEFLEKVAEGYFIQELEEQKRKDHKLKLNYFFDSFDFINLLQGGWSYDDGFKFDRSSFKWDSHKLSVYALAFDGLFGTVKMLPSHQREFEAKLNKARAFFRSPTQEDYTRLISEVLYAQEMGQKSLPKSLNKSNIDAHIQNLITKGNNLYKANYLLREKAWANRLKYLMDHKILDFSDYSQELENVKDSKLFEKIWRAFEQVRSDRTTNNFYDALALYHLQILLELHIQDPSKPLPVFFASSNKVKEAIDILRGENPQLFAYWNEENGKWIPIVRDSLFFVLEAVFTIGDKTESFFRELEDKQEEIKTLVRGEYAAYRENGVLIEDIEQSRRDFEKTIVEIINVKFIQGIWIEKRAYHKLIQELKEVYNLDEDKNLPLISSSIEKELEKTLQQAKINLQSSIKISAIIESFQDIAQYSKEILKQKAGPKLDVFRDFALMKFGLESKKLPDLQEIINALAHFAEDDNIRFPTNVYSLISALSFKPDTVEKSRQFLNALTIVWILEKYQLIEKIGADLQKDDIEQRYDAALIYAAALIEVKKGRKEGIERTKEVITCILEKKPNNYKVWIGVAYLYFRLWGSKTHLKPDIPEMHLQAWENQRKTREYKNYFTNGALKYAKKAYEYLNPRLKHKDAQKENQRLHSYLYALNNVIYYTTKCSSEKEFRRLADLVDELHNYESFIEWQGRFGDTLGWYYLRHHWLTSNERLKKEYLAQADKYCMLAENFFASPKDAKTFNQLRLAIIRTEAMGDGSDSEE
ncbi:MAG: hypothetical protein KDC85_11725 [Saprospiraceae bacterium]|nr:hypothetical protein [Saprospiraceae bacterium]